MAAFFLVARDWHMAVIAVVKVGKPAVMSAITIDSAIFMPYGVVDVTSANQKYSTPVFRYASIVLVV